MTNTTGARVRSTRARSGLSQLELAQRAGLSDAYVSLVESGKRTASTKALTAMAAALDTTAAYLADGENSPAEEAIRAAISSAQEQLAGGHPEAAEGLLKAVNPADVSHVNRLGYQRTWGLVRDALGEISASVDWFELALGEARTSGSPRDVAEIGMWLLSGHHDAGALDDAVRVGEAVLAEVETLGIDGTDEHLRLASTLVWALLQRGDRLYTRTKVREYLDIAEEVGTARGRGSIYWNAALIELELGGNDDEAVRLAQVALEAMLEAGSARDVPRLRYDYATILLRIQAPRPQEALEQLELAQEALRRIGSRVEVARCDIERARAWAMLGDLVAAEELATKGLADLSATGTLNLDTCAGFIVLGDAAVSRGDIATAEKRYTWAAHRLSMMSAARYSAQVWADLGVRMLAVGRHDAALAAYQNSLNELSVPSGQPLVRERLGHDLTPHLDARLRLLEPVGGWVAA